MFLPVQRYVSVVVRDTERVSVTGLPAEKRD